GLHHLCAEGPRITQGPQLDGSYRRRDAAGRAVGAFCMIGAFSERTVVDQASVVVIDPDIPLVQGTRLSGASMIIAADLVPAKLAWARGFGATHAVNAEGAALTSEVLSLTDGVGVDHAFVCIDPPATLLPAFRATAKAGNVVITALTPDTVTEINIPPLELLVTQKAIMGAVYGFASPRLQIPELLKLYRKGDLKLKELITRTYALEEVNRGYADLDAGKNLRGVIVF
ncbi:MAG: zinc-binding dehydrogenase, partial [Rhodoplanes sp.]